VLTRYKDPMFYVKPQQKFINPVLKTYTKTYNEQIDDFLQKLYNLKDSDDT